MIDTVRRRANWVIVVTYLLCLLLSVWPVPSWAEPYRPAWVVLATVYWCLFLPHRVGLLVTFSVGILLDTLTGSLLGEHALALLLVAWVTLKLHLQIRVYPWWQQTLVVFGLMLLYSFVLFWVDGMLGYTQGVLLRWMPVLITALLWPWIMQLINMLQQRYQVS
ncbi:MAG: rod shape-determining protein MreD [Gammaproteobacteria bacterium]|nr:rod shape-determining protein MreD [Gammaproteobacteria bacterium]MDE2345644.1 rod shape-determining protein MreD [Gammaproteobacteria bacterium]